MSNSSSAHTRADRICSEYHITVAEVEEEILAAEKEATARGMELAAKWVKDYAANWTNVNPHVQRALNDTAGCLRDYAANVRNKKT